jgi:hypothetical protein
VSPSTLNEPAARPRSTKAGYNDRTQGERRTHPPSRDPNRFSSGVSEPIPRSVDVISPELALVDPELRRIALEREPLREQTGALEVGAAAHREPVQARVPLPPSSAPGPRRLLGARLPLVLAALGLAAAAAFLAVAVARSLDGGAGAVAVRRTTPRPVARGAQPLPAIKAAARVAGAAKPQPAATAAPPTPAAKAKRPAPVLPKRPGPAPGTPRGSLLPKRSARVLPKRPTRVLPKGPPRALPKRPPRVLPKTTTKAASLVPKRSTAGAPAPSSFRPSRAWFWQAVPGAIAYDVVFVRGSRTIYTGQTKRPRLRLPADFRFTAGNYRMEVTATVRSGGKARKVTAAKVAFTVGRN